MGDFISNPSADVPAIRQDLLPYRSALLDVRTALASVSGGGPPPVYTTGTRPAAAVGNLGTFCVVRDPGVDDALFFCRLLAGGGYEWLPVGY